MSTNYQIKAKIILSIIFLLIFMVPTLASAEDLPKFELPLVIDHAGNWYNSSTIALGRMW